jgi:hypothetical protein
VALVVERLFGRGSQSHFSAMEALNKPLNALKNDIFFGNLLSQLKSFNLFSNILKNEQ